MSDNNPTNDIGAKSEQETLKDTNTDEDLERQKEVESKDADWFLQLLVKSVNTGTITFTITLNVGGLLVSGVLIGGKEYFKIFGTAFQDAFPADEEEERISEKAIHSLGDTYDEPESDEEKSKLPPPSYIHLKNAKFYHPSLGGAKPDQGVLWRGRLSEVEGFFLGSFHATDLTLDS